MYNSENSNSADRFEKSANGLIIFGNQRKDLIIKAGGSIPRIAKTTTIDMEHQSGVLFSNLLEDRKAFIAGKLSKADYGKRLQILKSLIDVKYYTDPTGDSVKLILDDWKLMHQAPAPKEEVKKSAEGKKLCDITDPKELHEHYQNIIAGLIKKDVTAKKPNELKKSHLDLNQLGIQRLVNDGEKLQKEITDQLIRIRQGAPKKL